MSDRFDDPDDRPGATQGDSGGDGDRPGRGPPSRADGGSEEDPLSDLEVLEDPAFDFDETTAKSIYVRAGALQRIEDVEALVDARLRTDHEVRDLTTREFYDAVLRAAAADPEAIVRAIADARREARREEDCSGDE